MKLLHRGIGGFVLVFLVSTLGRAPLHGSDDGRVVVHEWGTFTSIAGSDGRAVDWLPLRGPSDLPCFVERLGLDFKGTLAGKVRMETPVLYFYSPRETRVDVSVRFNRGVVTEWFPHAAVTPSTVSAAAAAAFRRPGFSSTAVWRDVTVMPQAAESFPDDHHGGHYYVARQTDATPLQVGAQHEKFLFYRGVGGFEPPLAATVAADGRVALENLQGAPLGEVMLFENRSGRITYRSLASSTSRVTIGPLALDGESATPKAELEKVLIAHGLFPAEAKAMVDTWRDSWFEEGSRLFYIVPRETIDAILPVDVTPAPSTFVRVFVGRVELMTEATRSDVSSALASNDIRTLAKYARFLPAIVNSLPDPPTDAERRHRASAVEAAQPPYAAAVCR
jgi:hypothetical protein